jgi:hypothetical protein
MPRTYFLSQRLVPAQFDFAWAHRHAVGISHAEVRFGTAIRIDW